MGNIYTIDDGIEEFTIKNKRGEVISTFAFNPADTGILSRYDAVVDFVNGYSFEDLENKDASDEDVAAAIIRLDNALTEQVAKLLNRPNAGAEVFAVYKPCSVMRDGRFYFESIIELFGKIIEEKLGERSEKRLKKIGKYTQKYNK